MYSHFSARVLCLNCCTILRLVRFFFQRHRDVPLLPFVRVFQFGAIRPFSHQDFRILVLREIAHIQLELVVDLRNIVVTFWFCSYYIFIVVNSPLFYCSAGKKLLFFGALLEAKSNSDNPIMSFSNTICLLDLSLSDTILNNLSTFPIPLWSFIEHLTRSKKYFQQNCLNLLLLKTVPGFVRS